MKQAFKLAPWANQPLSLRSRRIVFVVCVLSVACYGVWCAGVRLRSGDHTFQSVFCALILLIILLTWATHYRTSRFASFPLCSRRQILDVVLTCALILSLYLFIDYARSQMNWYSLIGDVAAAVITGFPLSMPNAKPVNENATMT